MELNQVYYIIASLVAIIGGIAAYGKFQAKDKEQEMRISFLEKESTEFKATIVKLFDNIAYMQRDLTQLRLDLKDKQNRV
jgi:uncharacterized coiled-coil protein SlyX